MNKLKLLFYFLVLALAFPACSGSDDDDNDDGGDGGGQVLPSNVNANIPTDEKAVTRLEFPKLKGGNNVVLVYRVSDNSSYDRDRVNYCVEWDCDKKSQRWSCYQMHSGYTGESNRVVEGYLFDSQLPSGAYWTTDYFYGSGYDHGHICPNADRKYSYDANYQTFYLTNMQPQYRKFNGFSTTGSDQGRGLWLRLEERLRGWTPTAATDTLYVCKGGTIDRESDIIGRIQGKLIVPRYFFVACLMKNSQGYKAIGFYMEQKNEWATNANLADYAMTIDELEEKTGIDFFCNLPDKIENDRESTMSLRAWGL